MTSQTRNKKAHPGGNKKFDHDHSLYDYIHPVIKPSENDAKAIFEFKNWKTFEFDGFKMPATKEARPDCQEYKTIGCLNKEEHKRKGYGYKNYIKRFCCSCGRLSCEKCFLKVIGREAERAKKRIEKYTNDPGEKLIQVVLSPSKEDFGLPEKKLRKKAIMILKEANVKDGALVYHPARPDYKKKEWYPSPHYHFVGFGWLRNLKIIALRYGWVVVYKGKRKTVFGTFCYMLSHCGVKQGRHTVTWLGKLSYGKLKVDKKPNSGKCPACGCKLGPVSYYGLHPVAPPDKEFEGFVDPEGWHLLESEVYSKNTKTENYEFIRNRELYYANKGIDLGLSTCSQRNQPKS